MSIDKKNNQEQAYIKKIMRRFADQLPEARCELVYKTPFQLLVSVVLSAQTTDKMVNRCMAPLYRKKFTPETILRMGHDKFLETIRSIGLAPTKAKNVLRLSELIIERHAGQVPATRDELQALPGVGRKTANVILGEIFGQPTMAVDTHVFRVTKRLGLHDAPNPEKCETILLEKIKAQYLPIAHHWFIMHGRYTCTAKAPKCDECGIADLCPTR